ncbi:MAG: ABC transporter ATP-binding protein, partial [Gammaproteobacteria bacterium]|nr:ABC transporter ATP-binding protein [Gammaproteobacteria bacterium]
KPADPDYIEKLLADLSLSDKKLSQMKSLSGGMKRRLLIAKALSHEPRILFLDEPTAGVDVNLRMEMWDLIHQLKESGVTVILTTHYIEEAEEMADRVAVINNGTIIVVERKADLMRKMGKKQMYLELQSPIATIPEQLRPYDLRIQDNGQVLLYNYETRKERTGITSLLKDLSTVGIGFKDLRTEQSSLEDIFIDLVEERIDVLERAERSMALDLSES